jgi:phenylacetate-CoA ligase
VTRTNTSAGRSDLYGALVDRLLFPGWEAVLKARPTLRHATDLARTQFAALAELERIQLDKLARLLRHARDHVPHYRERFRAVGFDPSDLRSIRDIERLPILSREEAQRTVEARTSTAEPRVKWRAVTGGTLGSALEFGYDDATEWWRKAARIRAWGWAGYEVGARTLYYVGVNHGLYVPPGKRTITWLERTLLQERYTSCMVRDDEHLRRVAEGVARWRPRILVCYPRAGGDLARYVIEHGLRTWSDVAVVCHGEKVFENDRRVMNDAFGEVFETYACRETYMVASECDAHDGLHIAMENVLVEILVREGKGYRRAGPGEVGEVVLTDLNNLGMPLIRYAIGDVAGAPRAEPCPCGRTLPRLPSIEGRVVETLLGPSGQRISSTLFEQIMMNTIGAALKQFQIVQHADRSITLRIVPAKELEDDGVAALIQHCREMVPGLSVSLSLVDSLPPDKTGKKRVVLVEQ